MWAWTVASHKLVYEHPGIGGEVEVGRAAGRRHSAVFCAAHLADSPLPPPPLQDIAWDSESKRIAACGGGQKKGAMFAFDTGSSLAPEISPHSKKNLSVSFRPAKPLRVVWGGEDSALSLYLGGPPFKFDRNLKEHTNFVNCVRYSPDGSRFVSVSSDKKAVVWDGETGTVVGKCDGGGGFAHSGSVMAVAWAPDGASFATASADKTVRVWDAATLSCTSTYVCGPRLEDMQCGLVWAAQDGLVSVSLEGTLTVIRPSLPADSSSAFSRVYGHVAAVCALARDSSSGLVYTGDQAGRVVAWTPSSPGGDTFTGALASGDAPAKRIGALCCTPTGAVLAGSWDDKLRVGGSGAVFAAPLPLGGQPKCIAAGVGGVTIAVTGAAIIVFSGGAEASRVPAPWGPTCVDVSADGSKVVVGGGDKRLHIFALSGTALTHAGDSGEATGAVSCVGFSPDGTRIASGDATREVRLHGADGAPLVVGKWLCHTTRVTGLAWAPEGDHFLTVGADRRVCLWRPAEDGAVTKSWDLAHTAPFAGLCRAGAGEWLLLGADGVVMKRALGV